MSHQVPTSDADRGSSFVVVDGTKVYVGTAGATSGVGGPSGADKQRHGVDVSQVTEDAIRMNSRNITTGRDAPGKVGVSIGRVSVADGISEGGLAQQHHALFFCSTCDMQFTDSNSALAHKASRRHRQKAGGISGFQSSSASSGVAALGLQHKGDGDVTIDDVRALISFKKSAKNIANFSEIRCNEPEGIAAVGTKRDRSGNVLTSLS